MNSATSKHDRIAEYKRRWNEIPFMRSHGLEVEEVAAGEVIVHLRQAADSQRGGGNNAGPALNGGVVAYLFDGALGWAITSALLELPGAQDIEPNDLSQYTLNLSISYLDAAVGDRFEAHGNAVRVSRSTAFAEGRLLDEKGKVCATANGVWRIFWPRTSRPA